MRELLYKIEWLSVRRLRIVILCTYWHFVSALPIFCDWFDSESVGLWESDWVDSNSVGLWESDWHPLLRSLWWFKERRGMVGFLLRHHPINPIPPPNLQDFPHLLLQRSLLFLICVPQMLLCSFVVILTVSVSIGYILIHGSKWLSPGAFHCGRANS